MNPEFTEPSDLIATIIVNGCNASRPKRNPMTDFIRGATLIAMTMTVLFAGVFAVYVSI
jgi:hypothetical protein